MAVPERRLLFSLQAKESRQFLRPSTPFVTVDGTIETLFLHISADDEKQEEEEGGNWWYALTTDSTEPKYLAVAKQTGISKATIITSLEDVASHEWAQFRFVKDNDGANEFRLQHRGTRRYLQVTRRSNQLAASASALEDGTVFIIQAKGLECTCTEQQTSSSVRRALIIGGCCVVGAGIAIAAAPVALAAVGFTSSGIASGSIAAGMMSSSAIAASATVVGGTGAAVAGGVAGAATASSSSASSLKEDSMCEQCKGIRVSKKKSD